MVRSSAAWSSVEQGLEIAKDQTPLAVPMAMVSKAEILFLAGEPEQAESVIAGRSSDGCPVRSEAPRVRTSTSSEGSLRRHGETTSEPWRSPTR
jgi:hypothetical protein